MIKIVTDTTCAMTLDEYGKYGIIAVPLYVRQGEDTQRELFDISYDQFYKSQRTGTKFTTSQPDPNSFLEVFRPIVEAGDEIICVTLSGKISGTINSVTLAAQMLNSDKVTVIDSKQSGFGQASMALRARELANSGASREDIVRDLDDLQSRTRTYFMVESLRYLYEGGRLSGAQALIGSLIQIKPIIWFDAEGTMEAIEKIRTLKAAKTRTMELIQERVARGVEKIALHYADNYDEAVEFGKMMEEIAGMPVPLIKLSPVLGTHTGPDLLGPCIISKN
ncbi:MAG TPA: DegV family protein [Bacillota bacterium]